MNDPELTAMTLSESAAKRIRFLMDQEDQPDAAVRVAVSGGGCAGFQYGFDFDVTIADDDFVFEREGARVVVDPLSLSFLQGSEVDYVEELIGASFQITIPKASSSCSCGTSFAM
jgi:iron-sulfur cluster insertion protein